MNVSILNSKKGKISFLKDDENTYPKGRALMGFSLKRREGIV